MKFILLCLAVLVLTAGCAIKEANVAMVASVKEDPIEPGAPFLHPLASVANNDPEQITRVTFYRKYTILDADGNTIKKAGVKIKETVVVVKDVGNQFNVGNYETVTDTNGEFGDTPFISRDGELLPGTFDLIVK